jgi:hypothetical protein
MAVNKKHPAQVVAEASAYPFARPGHSFLFLDGEVVPLLALDLAGLDARLAAHGLPLMAARTPVLAYGANAAPERLALKFAPLQPGIGIPVLRARLFDFDIVHACHFSSYGAIPATLQVSQGTVVDVAVTWLDDRALERMTNTELGNSNYAYGLLHDVHVEVSGMAPLSTVASYWTRRGCLDLGQGPIALSAISAEGRGFLSLAKRDVLAAARDHFAPAAVLDDFIVENVANADLRRARSAQLADQAVPFLYDGIEILITG